MSYFTTEDRTIKTLTHTGNTVYLKVTFSIHEH